MSQPSTSLLPPADDNFTVLLVEPRQAITESEAVLDEDSWRALLIQIDREEDTG